MGNAAGATSLSYNNQEQTTSINPYGAGAQTIGYRGKGQNDPFQIGTQPTGGAAPGLEEDTLGISAQYASSSSGVTPSSSYTYFTRAPDGTLLAERTGGGISGSDYYYVQDANGSVVALTSSSVGAPVANTYSYDPYGATTSFTYTGSTAAPNSFGFDGGYYPSCITSTSAAGCPSATAGASSTASNGLIQFGTRYYNPATATWTQPDPLGLSLVTDPTQRDLYGFVGGDPVNVIDGDGESGVKTRLGVCFTQIALGVGAICNTLEPIEDALPKNVAHIVETGAQLDKETVTGFKDALQKQIADAACESLTKAQQTELVADKTDLSLANEDLSAMDWSSIADGNGGFVRGLSVAFEDTEADDG